MTGRVLPGALAALLLAGCAVGPDYKSPQADAPAQTPFAGAATPSVSAQAPTDHWWQLYNDTALNGYIGEALGANRDLRVALATLQEARAALHQTQAARFPSTTASGSFNYGRQSAAAQGDSPAYDNQKIYDAGFDASYQIDILGKVKRAIEASRADAQAQGAAYDLVRITVAAEVARAYADACSTGQQIIVARQSLALQQDEYDLTNRSLEAGRGAGLDVARAAALVEQTRATIPSLEAAQRGALYRLAVLMGRPPASFPAEAAKCATPPTLQSAIPVGDGKALLERRPDLRQAERQLAAATARIGVAVGDLYPDVSLGGSIGTTALSFNGTGDNAALRFGIGPLISWTFPNILAARAQVEAAKASTRGALANFEGAWLSALQETETALANYANELQRTAALRRARDHSADAVKLVQARFDAGSASFLEALDAERTLADTSLSLAQSQGQLSSDQIALFLALGGGWN